MSVDDLNDEQRKHYFMRMEKAQKDPDTYAVLIWCFGSFGAHRFYLGHKRDGYIHLALGLGGYFLLLIGLAFSWGSFGIGIALLLLLADLGIWTKDLIYQKQDFKKFHEGLEQSILEVVKKP